MIKFKTIEYNRKNNEVIILDQTRLPEKEVYIRLKSVKDVYHATKNLNLRGAPLIGVAAAYGLVLAAYKNNLNDIVRAAQYLKSARPTAINLAWAIERVMKRAAHSKNIFSDVLHEAQQIETEDKKSCLGIGTFGARLIPNSSKIMVHCNAGALATSGIGTALGVLYTAKRQGKKFVVYSCETRPVLQGARLTSWELTKNGIKTYTICDNMAAAYMPDMDAVLVGADRIARNGDVANKIGTRGLAIIAQYYHVPFYVAAPLSTFDPGVKSGSAIPIEMRSEDEIRQFSDRCIVAKNAQVCNPAFDVTPASLITAIITERGIIKPPLAENIRKIIINVK